STREVPAAETLVGVSPSAVVVIDRAADSHRSVAVEIAAVKEAQRPAERFRRRAVTVRRADRICAAVANIGASTSIDSEAAVRVLVHEIAVSRACDPPHADTTAETTANKGATDGRFTRWICRR